MVLWTRGERNNHDIKSITRLGGMSMMASTARVIAPQRMLENPLAHLPCSSILEYKKGQSIYSQDQPSTSLYLVEYKKGQSIYSQDQPSTSLYLVIEGKVKVSRMADDGHQVILDIYQTDEFFGESALVNLPQRTEQATAMENTRLMSWTAAEIEDIVSKRPRLAVALLQILVQRTMEFGHRIESFSLDSIARR